jgi:pyrrolidone-carboxylate peptidase
VAEADSPDVILCIGQAGGRSAVTPERIAINLNDARIPDNGGFQPAEQPIDPEGPDGLFATVPVSAMAEAIRAATMNPARAIGAADMVGTITEGKVADFLVCNQDYSQKRVFLAGNELK